MNYILEGGGDFNEELHRMICKGAAETAETCMIGGETLSSTPVTLQCGHSFNYPNILNEVKAQKRPQQSSRRLEVCKVSRYEIKCPYCRRIHKGVLPYRPEHESTKLVGINWPPAKVLWDSLCKAILKSGRRIGESCGRQCREDYCRYHQYYVGNKKVEQTNIGIASEQTNSVVGYPYAGLCQVILRYGKRKGTKCLCKSVSTSTGTCRRHLSKKDNK